MRDRSLVSSSSMDAIILHDLELWTHIGVPDEERKIEQRLLVTVELMLDAGGGAGKDEPGIDYDLVAQELQKIAQKERKTIERFAEDASAAILQKFKPASVTVCIKKFAIPGSKYVEIRMTRP